MSDHSSNQPDPKPFGLGIVYLTIAVLVVVVGFGTVSLKGVAEDSYKKNKPLYDQNIKMNAEAAEAAEKKAAEPADKKDEGDTKTDVKGKDGAVKLELTKEELAKVTTLKGGQVMCFTCHMANKLPIAPNYAALKKRHGKLTAKTLAELVTKVQKGSQPGKGSYAADGVPATMMMPPQTYLGGANAGKPVSADDVKLLIRYMLTIK